MSAHPRLTLLPPAREIYCTVWTIAGGFVEILAVPGKPVALLIVEGEQRAAVDLTDASARALAAALGER